MELQVLNTAFVSIGVVDTFETLIWNDQFCTAGDFEITAPPDDGLVTAIAGGQYLALADSEHIMVIDQLSINTDVTNGNKVIVKGVSLEKVLDRRIVWNVTNLSGDFQTAVHQLLNENAISPTDTARTIPNLLISVSTDPAITALAINKQINGAPTLYDTIVDLCAAFKIGFKLVLDADKNMVFSLYAGTDRSYAQETNPYIVFSPANDNLQDSKYTSNVSGLKTVALVHAKGDGSESIDTTVAAPGGAGTGLARREMYIDATSITQATPEGVLNTTEYLADVAARGAAYVAQILQKGQEELATNKVVETFEGTVDPVRARALYLYGRDYFMGDIVEVENEYGQNGRSQMTGWVNSEDNTGAKNYPTFKIVANN